MANIDSNYHIIEVYNQIVPENLKNFITPRDLYSNIEYLLRETSKTGVYISTTSRRIINMYIHDKNKTQEIIRDILFIDSAKYICDFKDVINLLKRYIEHYISMYPMRVVTIKQRSIHTKDVLKKMYHNIEFHDIRIIDFLKAYYNTLINDEKNGIGILIYHDDYNQYNHDETSKRIMKKEFKLIVSLMENEDFCDLIRKTEHTKKEEILSIIDDINNMDHQ